MTVAKCFYFMFSLLKIEKGGENEKISFHYLILQLILRIDYKLGERSMVMAK